MAFQGTLLFRALSAHDNATAGLSPTAPRSEISIREHVERGGFNVHIDSQFISTTKDLRVALRWVSVNQSTLAIILCDNLDPNVNFSDISEGHESLSLTYNDYAIRHSEVLLHADPQAMMPVQPLVSPNAVWPLSYHELVQIYLRSPHPPFPEDMAQEWQEYFLSSLDAQFFYICTYCQGYGHVQGGCRRFSNWLVEEAAIDRYYELECIHCRCYGHDINNCQRFDDWEAEEAAIQRYYDSVTARRSVGML